MHMHMHSCMTGWHSCMAITQGYYWCLHDLPNLDPSPPIMHKHGPMNMNVPQPDMLCPHPHLHLCMAVHGCALSSTPLHTLISALKPSCTHVCTCTCLCALVSTFAHPCHACT